MTGKAPRNAGGVATTPAMFKFAFALGIVFALFGTAVNSPLGLAMAAIRVFCVILLSWMALEAARAVIKAALSLDDRSPG